MILQELKKLPEKQAAFKYHRAGNFRRELIFGYFEKAFLFENNFLVAAFLRKLIPTTKLTASHEDFSVSERACVMAYLSSRLQTLEHGTSEFIPAFHTSEFIPAFQMSIDMASMHVLHPNAISTRMWFYVNIRSV